MEEANIEKDNNDECQELKNIKYKTMLLNSCYYKTMLLVINRDCYNNNRFFMLLAASWHCELPIPQARASMAAPAAGAPGRRWAQRGINRECRINLIEYN